MHLFYSYTKKCKNKILYTINNIYYENRLGFNFIIKIKNRWLDCTRKYNTSKETSDIY